MSNAEALVEVVKAVCGAAVVISSVYFMYKLFGDLE